MNTVDLTIEKAHMEKLLCAANGDAALLYLYLHSGNPLQQAAQDLRLSQSRLQCAEANLRQLGLWQQDKVTFVPGQRPDYTDFLRLYGEVQRVLGKSLNTEELKILLGFVRYLGLSSEVISLLVTYCKERSRQKGSLRNPSLRSIEKEAYAWAEQGIDTVDEAIAFITRQNIRNSRLGQLMKLLQIRGRNLTAGEERYAQQWLDMGFEEDALALAYERTCLNTGGLSWAYMHKILTRWHEAGIHTLAEIQAGDKKSVPKGASGQLGQAELDAIQKALREG